METSLPLSLKLVRNGILDPMTLIAKMSTNPARIIGLPAGQLKPGASADVTVIDPEVSFTVDANSFKSKARNCPFDGWNLQGKAALTIVEGRIIHRSPPFDLG